MNDQKIKMKEYIKDFVEKQKYSKSFWRRVETICRANINRLSYELKYEETQIYLQRSDRKRIIEIKARSPYISQYVFKTVEKLMAELKQKFPKEEI